MEDQTANNLFHPPKVESLDKEEQTLTLLAAEVMKAYEEAKQARELDEKRWLTAFHNYRGVYPKSMKFRESEKSRVFVKITKTKVVAAFGQLIDVIFGTTQFPMGVTATEIPEGSPEFAHVKQETRAAEPKQNPEDHDEGIGFAGDGRTLKPGAVMFKEQTVLSELEDAGVEVVPEPAAEETDVQISPAKEAARKMEKLILDQIEESNGTAELRSAFFECALLGTGIIKGPFNYEKTLHRWETNEETGERTYTPSQIRVPRCEFVRVWDFFPDPYATCMEDAEYVIQRHLLNRAQVRDLQNMPHFRHAELQKVIMEGPNHSPDHYEQELRDGQAEAALDSNRYEVVEYWGTLSREACIQCGVELEEVQSELDSVQVNAWICHNKVIRAVINPFTPHRLPYHVFPYERNPYSFFGIGIAENMEDSQAVMNGHARMAIDNAALSGSLVFDIDTSMLEAGQDTSIYPGKAFRRQSGMPGQAVYGIKFPNTTNENMLMFDKFRQLSDEQTGIPSYSHGITGVQSTTRTAAGMSMLMGAASLNIKTVVKNIDDFLLKPLGKAFYQWNMQFFEGPLDIQGDLEIKAMGTSSLMQKEVRSQRLTSLLSAIQNPVIAPYIKIETLVKEMAVSHDLDPQELINSPEERKLAQKILGKDAPDQSQGQAPTQGAGSPPGVGGIPTPPNAPPGTDPTGAGGGNIGVGNVPQPGEGAFAGQPPQA